MSKKEEKKAKNIDSAKSAKTKKVKEKKQGKDQSRDNSFINISLALCTVAILVSLIAGGIIFWQQKQVIAENNETNKESTLQLYRQLVNSEVQLLAQDLESFAGLIINKPELLTTDDTAISEIKRLASSHLNNTLDFKLFVQGDYTLDKDSYPPVNFSAQKQLLSAESSTAVFPEYYKNSQGNYFSTAISIKHPDTKELLYTFMASYPESIISSRLPKTTLRNTNINLLQAFESGSPLTIHSSGKDVRNKNSQTVETDHPNWKLEYTSNQADVLTQDLLVAIGAGIILNVLLMCASIFLSLLLLRKNISTDASLIYEFMRSAGKKSISSTMFKTGLMLALYRQLKDIAPSTPKKKTTNGRNKLLDKDEDNFDIDIADGDENLFGGDEDQRLEQASSKKTSSALIPAGIFRAYDIRGVVDETLTAEGVKMIGQAIGSEAISQGDNTVIIARDGRLSGPSLSEALKQGLLDSGANVIDIGMVPTPLLYFACKTLDSSSGVMLTGSHNPSNHNGLKIVINGVTLSTDGIQKLRKRIEENQLSSGEGTASEQDVVEAYLDAIENDVILAQPMNVVIDCGNGVTGVIAERLFEQIGCNVTPLFTEVDGHFPNHHPDPSQPKNLEALIQKVKETKAHLGIAFDGDGDRLGIVTNTGKVIWPDRLMMLFSRDILLRSPGADIIFDVKCSNTLADTIRKQGGRPLMWKTGHSLIKAKLLESGAQLAGEMSGHIFFNDRWYGFDDGLYSAARLLEILSTDGKPAEEVFSAFPEMVSTPEINIAIDDETKFDLLTILASVGDFGEGNKTDIDGIRIDYNDGWGLIRASNTTANLVTRFEAKTEQRLSEIQGIFKEQLLKVQGDLEIPF